MEIPVSRGVITAYEIAADYEIKCRRRLVAVKFASREAVTSLSASLSPSFTGESSRFTHTRRSSGVSTAERRNSYRERTVKMKRGKIIRSDLRFLPRSFERSRFLRKILASALRTNRVEASCTFLQTGREKEAGREGSLRGLFRKCVFQLRCYLGLFEKLDVCRFVR